LPADLRKTIQHSQNTDRRLNMAIPKIKTICAFKITRAAEISAEIVRNYQVYSFSTAQLYAIKLQKR
jgi:hypothetical protein